MHQEWEKLAKKKDIRGSTTRKKDGVIIFFLLKDKIAKIPSLFFNILSDCHYSDVIIFLLKKKKNLNRDGKIYKRGSTVIPGAMSIPESRVNR